MGDPALRRFWNAIKPPPAAPRRGWQPPAPSAWTRFLDAVRPPPPVQRSGALLAPAVAARRRRILISVAAAIFILAAGWELYRYVRTAPQRAAAAIEEGRRLAATGKEDLAIGRLNRAIELQPQSAAAFLQRGLVRHRLGQIDAAFKDFGQAAKLNPHLAEPHVALGSIYRDRGDLPRALNEFSAALDQEPSVDAYYQRGRSYEALGQHRQAIENYNAAVALLPSSPEVYRARASAEVAVGDAQAAKRDRDTAEAIENHLAGVAPAGVPPAVPKAP